MRRMQTREARRTGVVFNYFGLVGLGTAVCLGEYGTWNGSLTVLAIGCLIVAVISFVLTYGRTGIWKLAHMDAGDLDERQLQITHGGFRRSYVVLGAASMILLIVVFVSVRFSVFTLTWRGHYSFGLVALMFMNYLIQILPASFLAWEEKVAPMQE